MRPGTYARNNHDAYRPAPCPRCGGEPHVTWVDTTTWGDRVPTDEPIGRRYCETPGCVDEHGSNAVPIGSENPPAVVPASLVGDETPPTPQAVTGVTAPITLRPRQVVRLVGPEGNWVIRGLHTQGDRAELTLHREVSPERSRLAALEDACAAVDNALAAVKRVRGEATSNETGAET